MATPVTQSRDTLIHSGSPADSQSAPGQSESEQEYNSPTKSDQDSSQDDSSDNQGAETETPPSDSQKRQGTFNSRRDSPNDSQESYSPLASLEHLKCDRFQGGERKDKSQGYKKGGSFVVPKFPEDYRREAYTRVKAALAQVHQAVHLNQKGNRTTATLYVGNLKFNASEENLYKSLNYTFNWILVDNITIPRVNGVSKHGCIDISRAHQAPVKLAYICITLSGRIQVNSRPICFRKLRDKVNKQ